MRKFVNEPQQVPSEAGKKVKNYIYQYADLIGNGNFAKVYKGINLNTNEIVAIKLISLDELKSQHLENLVFEQIRILQQFSHPNVLRFIEALLSERNCYIITELCRQGSLEDRIKMKIPFSDEELGKIIVDLWKGLKYMKEKGVAHRDFKPANIFISNGHMKIADFGLAKFFTERFHDLDIGSPQYMSPEGFILNCYSDKTDIWSFGITIYELLHGETPFLFCKTEQQMRYFLTRPVPEERWRKDVNPYLRRLVNRMLEVDQYKRPNIYELAEQPYLRELLESEADRQQAHSWQGNFRVYDQNHNQQNGLRPGMMQGQQSYIAIKSKSMNNKTTIIGSQSSPLKSNFQQLNPYGKNIPQKIPESRQVKQPFRYSFSKKQANDPIYKAIQTRCNQYPTELINNNHSFDSRPQQNNNICQREPISPMPMNQFRNHNPPFVYTQGIQLLSQRQLSSNTLETNESEDERRSPNSRNMFQVKRG